MEPTGDRLRRARDAKRLSLRDVAAATKISASALEALERNDFSRVPGGIYGRSFVRAYAELVDLPGDEIVEAFGVELAQYQRDRARRQVRSSVTPGDREFLARQERAMKLLRAGIIALAVIVVVAVVWFGWRRLGRSETVSTSPADAIPSGPAGSGASFTPLAPPPAAAIPPLAPAQGVPAIGERIVVEVRITPETVSTYWE